MKQNLNKFQQLFSIKNTHKIIILGIYSFGSLSLILPNVFIQHGPDSTMGECCTSRNAQTSWHSIYGLPSYESSLRFVFAICIYLNIFV